MSACKAAPLQPLQSIQGRHDARKTTSEPRLAAAATQETLKMGGRYSEGTNHELLINQQGERTNPRYRPRHTEKEARFLRRWHFLGLSLVPAILGQQTLFLAALIQFQGSVYF